MTQPELNSSSTVKLKNNYYTPCVEYSGLLYSMHASYKKIYLL